MTGNTENFLLPYTKKEMWNYNYIIIIKQKQKPKIIFPQALKSQRGRIQGIIYCRPFRITKGILVDCLANTRPISTFEIEPSAPYFFFTNSFLTRSIKHPQANIYDRNSFSPLDIHIFLIQSFPYKNHCEFYKKLASTSWPVLLTLTYFVIHTLLLENTMLF